MVSKKIDYNEMTNKALLKVVRDILEIIAEKGVYKKQHLCITFATNHLDVEMSEFLREEFEEEMIIILQYEFWDLIVDEHGFYVSLSFEHGEETLYVPFASIVSVMDPSEGFCLELTPSFENVKKKEIPEVTAQKSNVIFLDMFKKEKQ
ncbi:MAG: ClpXP protease specificity-enhancing factor SspB [Holosporales bacterium]|jgi:hypothetical protein|nr:ClpXP protease specificity-enhancing factor SspB [Holosporales bacterium]